MRVWNGSEEGLWLVNKGDRGRVMVLMLGVVVDDDTNEVKVMKERRQRMYGEAILENGKHIPILGVR